ncbi:crotonobetainyl-CoA:carnitine CoA-transferase CaiB-like acyl-CoA transferase [Humitalea rosea]|uniref:Crotonobetainyl-CoA:carnitine CoA-transferase CaiB-like acyl-CoA transferase n=1 Tax=Humitalea rosea TaxID=990373 RepID=A0A2W7IRG6_9PROT|nr:crotonobetainyl-CoA:carnitine CoA-transferase CaiB-like acyl-CoA transferase [Humitalea rosea]
MDSVTVQQDQTAAASLEPGAVAADAPGMLQGLRVVEFADELAEYAGLLLAGMGAEVVKVEPPAGAATRQIGPFAGDMPDPERSLHFWTYNRGKRSVTLDIADPAQRDALVALIGSADIVLDSTRGGLHAALGETLASLPGRFPGLIVARITPFGDTGPWKDHKASDLIHLALGGVMMNCGYDAAPPWDYDLPPIAPQLWHAYHIAGEQLLVGILAAVLHRLHTGEGQDVSVAVHDAVSKNTELDVMSWVMRRAPLYRMTCRHAGEQPTHVPNIGHTKDGRWCIALGLSARDQANLLPFLSKYGMQADLAAPGREADLRARNVPGSSAADEGKAHIVEVIQRFIRAYTYEDLPWPEAQAAGLLWAPLRKPHENVADVHWQTRGTFAEIEHPELGRALPYPVSRWLSTETRWQTGTRAPRLGEHTAEVLADPAPRVASVPARPRSGPARLSARGKAFPLQGVRIFDFSWFLASAGGTRLCAALGADVIKVEWKENPDTRLAAMAPVGGREARSTATGPLPGVTDSDMGGQFNNKNAGKSGLSLNIRHPKGLEIARRMIAQSDVVAEGFSPGVLKRLGLGYEALTKIRPDIIYVQQSGMGGVGTYGRFRTIGPVAAAFAGAAEMSGLREPAMPAGWGYSYLDWIGAYSFAMAIMGALFHRDRTGRGQWVDSSQCETGIFHCGVPILDHAVNGRSWERIGNRSPYKPAAPHGAYRCAGQDRWIAIACFTEEEWAALCRIAGTPAWAADPRFATLAARLAHQDALEAALTSWTTGQEAHTLMAALQVAGVPAGVCQNAEDRCDHDPQLAALDWMTEVTGTKIGRWPVTELPSKLSATPPYSGGITDRGAPGYGEDNERLLRELLGYSAQEVADLAAEGVI